MRKLIILLLGMMICTNVNADFNSGDTFGKGIVVQSNGASLTGGGRTLNFSSGTTVVASGGVYNISASGSGGGVSSISNSDGTLTISPTTGAAIASLALGHNNLWTGQQTFSTSPVLIGSSTGASLSGGAGALTIAGLGNTNNEDMKVDLETNSNQWTFTSSTGVNKMTFGSILNASIGTALNTTVALNISGTSTGGGNLTGIQTSQSNSNTGASAGATGINVTATRSGTGSATDLTLIGVKATSSFSGTTGTQSTGYGIYGVVTNSGAGGTLTDAYSVYGAAPVSTGTITNAWAGGFAGAVKFASTPSVSSNGALWTDNVQNTLDFYNSSVKQAISTILFTQTADKTITNTTSETTMIGTGVGTTTLPANFFVAGKTIRIAGGGVYSSALTAGNITVNVKYGSTVLASATINNIANNVTTQAFQYSTTITCRSKGASGTVVADGNVSYETTLLSRGFGDLNNAGSTTTIDTTTSNAIDVTLTWATGSTSNILKLTNARVEVLN